MIPTAPAEAATELGVRADLLARALRVAPRFTDALSWWVGYGLRRVQRVPDRVHTVDQQEALLLNLPEGWEVARREGFLVSAVGGDTEPLAAVTSLLHVNRLGLSVAARAALHEGNIPVGVIAGDAHRSTHYVAVLDTAPEPDQPALKVRATLVSGGRPAVLTEEIVYWRAVLARPSRGEPPVVPTFAARAEW